MENEKEKVLLYDAIDSSILKSIPNPSKEPYEIKVKVPEFTFPRPFCLSANAAPYRARKKDRPCHGAPAARQESRSAIADR